MLSQEVFGCIGLLKTVTVTLYMVKKSDLQIGDRSLGHDLNHLGDVFVSKNRLKNKEKIPFPDTQWVSALFTY